MGTASLADTLLASVLAGGVATTLGAVPVMVKSTIRRSTEGTLLGFGAGVMLAASAFSLLLPGLERASSLFGGTLWPASLVGAGFLVGGALISLAHEHIPHEHFMKG